MYVIAALQFLTSCFIFDAVGIFIVKLQSYNLQGTKITSCSNSVRNIMPSY
jgi:hypothetical protein